ncbi:hypothetical protein DFH08DRAFT_808284 [Mycena albidolilacea]|uniref:Uncharacterized protein n=1 Tax=Mycena albidolilacea TaxID=1033008 RepID=A0AAD7ET70_9AGAR|nr:hypothetical protein DFH08DRAFT_808284 [Mycena albidolilacea]
MTKHNLQTQTVWATARQRTSDAEPLLPVVPAERETLVQLAVPDSKVEGGFCAESAYAPYMDVLASAVGPKDIIPVPIDREGCNHVVLSLHKAATGSAAKLRLTKTKPFVWWANRIHVTKTFDKWHAHMWTTFCQDGGSGSRRQAEEFQ